MKRRLQEKIVLDGRAYVQTLNLPTIVCFTGSTRFAKEYMEANLRETLAGNIVLTVGGFMHSPETHGGAEISDEQKVALDKLHLKKIDLADEVFVINVDQYVGESTMSEIAYAVWKRKPIRWLEHPLGERDTPPSEGTELWLQAHRQALGKLIAGHAGSMGLMRDLGQTITLDQDMKGLGKKGDTIPIRDMWDWAATTGFELGYHRDGTAEEAGPGKPLTGTRCAVCGEPRFDTDSGVSCLNGHGGA